ncbi:hypothetical protein ADIS_0364 [Lunatimonas lonarensis]|uniref:Uncharacterized protein n=1 Tax=Lunatimonas lonarensis TaxID=1232681 RepID=R7ZYH8_9BACT|nr:hypothetical protein ADIS_0364 [Lunatimonas lonarensis]
MLPWFLPENIQGKALLVAIGLIINPKINQVLVWTETS